MNKILTIVVPSYNMQDYLHRCLDSMIVSEEYMKKLEVIIVNDGSKDSTSEIAHEYQIMYPNTFIAIDKENGHYGSCVNAALRLATGKYLRLVDADDWVNTDALVKFMNVLSMHNEDAIYTKFTQQYLYKGTSKPCDIDGIEWRTYDLNKEKIPMTCLAMHGMTFRRELLKNINYIQTEGIAYTDTEFVYFPLSQAQSLYCLDIDLYQYFVGRGEQTMAKCSIVNNYEHFKKLYESLWKYVPACPNKNALELRHTYLTRIMGYMLTVQIIYTSGTKERELQLKYEMNLLKEKENIVYLDLMNKKVHEIRYVRNWMIGGIRCCIQKIFFSLYRMKIER